ncbi:hypothetical protein HYH03_008819 [Edaphochlamys debaryana]|uniref:Uncharacterized protein n=1 Tax=Edaphochlamys debaryana TaxID=47281 RepID=A0A835Y5K8_9CHLO|nr:hypothetical protein HYH03_008819 [Edaphochlamys debaryana]|eukprot:KAG2492905.1 hypothetical protein HYH03_008819 [Edaphochlamys debaryana]
MVNVDFASPSLLLGTVLIGSGVMLLNLRNFQNKVSRDADIVVAAMVSIVGSTLIFQGWRLDPLLLLCQALTTSVAFWYGLETFRLRSKEADLQDQMPPRQLPPGMGMGMGSDPMSDQAQAAAFFAQQAQQGGMPYLPPGSEQYGYPWGGASTSGRAPAAPGPYGEMIQYDYYGNPILPAQQEPAQYDSVGAGPGPYSGAYGAADPYGGGYGAGPGPGSTGAEQGPPPGWWGNGAEAYGSRGAPPAGPGPYGQGPYGGGGYDGGPAPAPPPGSAQGPDRFSLPAVTSATAAGGAGVGPGPGPGAMPPPGPGGSPPGGARGWEARPPAAAPGPAAASGGRGQAGRMDLGGAVDDWE